MIYLPFGSEMDTFPLIQELLSRDKRVYAPKILDGLGLGSVLFDRDQPLKANSLGLFEPTGPLMPRDFRADVVVVPGLGFDRRGHRLGYGKGYYDRYLSLRPKVCVGLSFRCQVVDEVPTEEHDIALDAVITADGPLSPQDGF